MHVRVAIGGLLAALALALALGGCGSDGDEGASSVSSSPSDEHRVDTTAYELPVTREPRAHIPSGPPPKRLRMEDVRAGRGATAKRGSEVIVNYVAYHYATKRRYDSSYGTRRTKPLPLVVVPGRGDFIEGFEEGIVGMRVGGRRQLTIPPDKAYGAHGYSDDVRPNETVVFVVDLEAVR